jgi:hypothetical protein
MSKLLSGQQLFMSKHIKAQQTSEDIDGDKFVPPTVTIAPCVMTILTGGEPLWVPYVGLKKADTGLYWKAAQELERGNYKFNDLPETFPPSILYGIHGFCDPIPSEVVTTRAQLIGTHYLQFAPVTGVAIATWGILPYRFDYLQLSVLLGTLQASGGVYSYEGTYPQTGNWRIEFTVELHDLVPDVWYLKHEHRPNTSFHWTTSRYPVGWTFDCERDPWGVHHVRYCHQSIHLIY